MNKFQTMLVCITAIAGLVIYGVQVDCRYAKAGQLELSNTRLELHILSDRINELEAQIFNLEWLQRQAPLNQDDARVLAKKKLQLKEAIKMRDLYLERIVK